MATPPNNLKYGKVVGRLVRAIGDTNVDADILPDIVPIVNARVIFTASITHAKNRSSTPPVTIFFDPIEVSTDNEGYLVNTDGTREVMLIASDDPNLDPTNFTYHVKVLGDSIAPLSWSMLIYENGPDNSGANDLSVAVPVPPNPGEDVEHWQDAVRTIWSARDASVNEVKAIVEVGGFLFEDLGDVSGVLDLSGVSKNSIVHITLIGNVSVSLPTSPVAGQTITLECAQDSTGDRTLTSPESFTSYGSSLELATSPHSLTELMFFYDGIRWHGRVSGRDEQVLPL